MGAAEALVLLFVGFFAGVLSAVFDVLAMGGASFLSHFALWVVLNAVLAVHVESRVRAILWSIPFTFGYIESYFIATVASFECYQKSLVVPLAAIAIISPLLAYALWTARKEKNAYGQVLAVLIVVGTLVASYLVNGKLGIYDGVMCVALYLVLKVMPARQLKITPSTRVPLELEHFEEDEAEEEEPSPVVPTERHSVADKKPVPQGRHMAQKQRPSLSLVRTIRIDDTGESAERRDRRSTAKRRDVQIPEVPERKEQRKQRPRRPKEGKHEREVNRIPNTEGMSTLGNVRPVRRSTRSI